MIGLGEPFPDEAGSLVPVERSFVDWMASAVGLLLVLPPAGLSLVTPPRGGGVGGLRRLFTLTEGCSTRSSGLDLSPGNICSHIYRIHRKIIK